MYIKHPHRVISLSQIINKNQAMYRIRFASDEKFVNPEYWLKLIRKRANFAHFEVTVVDETPKEDNEKLKRYSILYGLKYLFAAEILNLDSIPVKVLKYSDNLDSSVVTEFFNSDYLSLSAYEKGEFIDKLMRSRNMSVNVISAKTGFSYNSLYIMFSAYNTAKLYPHLEAAYKESCVTAANVLHSKTFYEEIPLGSHQELTGYLIRNGNYAYKSLNRAVKNSEENISKAQAILTEITSANKPVHLNRTNRMDRISTSLKEDGLPLSEREQKQIAEKMKTDRRYNKQVLSYQTLRDKCREAYNSLSSALSEELVLDFDTAVTLPDRTQFSYAVPQFAKKLCRNNTPKDVNEKRLFARIMEYLDKTGAYPEAEDMVSKTHELFGKPEMQHMFSEFFKYCIFYRNMRNKLILESR